MEQGDITIESGSYGPVLRDEHSLFGLATYQRIGKVVSVQGALVLKGWPLWRKFIRWLRRPTFRRLEIHIPEPMEGEPYGMGSAFTCAGKPVVLTIESIAGDPVSAVLLVDDRSPAVEPPIHFNFTYKTLNQGSRGENPYAAPRS